MRAEYLIIQYGEAYLFGECAGAWATNFKEILMDRHGVYECSRVPRRTKPQLTLIFVTHMSENIY